MGRRRWGSVKWGRSVARSPYKPWQAWKRNWVSRKLGRRAKKDEV